MRYQQTLRFLGSMACCAFLGCQPNQPVSSTADSSDGEATRSPESNEAGTPASSSQGNSAQAAHAEGQDEHPSAPASVSAVPDQKRSKKPIQLTEAVKAGKRDPATNAPPSLETELPSESTSEIADDPEERTEVRETFHPNGSLLRQWIVKILPDGTEVEHGESLIRYDDGQVKMQGEYFDGVRDGLWRSWYADGQMRGEGRLQMDRRTGTWTMWYASGQMRIKTPYEMGLSHGLSTSWDADGKVTETGEYVRRKKHGTWVSYVDGKKIETQWLNGVQVE